MSVDSDATPFAAMVVGFVLTVLFLLGALFQDVLARTAARVSQRAAKPARAAAARVGRATGAAAARAGTVRWLPRVAAPRAPAAPAADPCPEEAPDQTLSEDAVADADEPVPARREAVETRSTPEDAVRRRIYRPASSVHVEAAVRDFVANSGGTVSLERLVRHLNREFGHGLGVSLVESLRNRNLLQVRRRAGSPTELDVVAAEGWLKEDPARR